MTNPKPMLSVSEARARILEHFAPLPVETVPLVHFIDEGAHVFALGEAARRRYRGQGEDSEKQDRQDAAHCDGGIFRSAIMPRSFRRASLPASLP